ncbi:CLUMA_CG000447, isoform A [Clunio marinus]|uniref:CLUMA_CG000447, isoform A n=1 Tax=Clunio marinus TaxID=568069 RepID=A0A1J1HGC9_9DIPT|nr:CLUMA_CG000447, isoform A [Clunio marinus]
MELEKIKSFCQFCMQEQMNIKPMIPINKELKQNFFELTRYKLNTKRYSEFICCEPCLKEFESVIAYRETLLKNQKVLKDLYAKSSTKSSLSIEKIVKNDEEIENEQDVSQVFDIEICSKEFVDTEALVVCENCHEELNESSLDHHVCPPMKVEELEESYEEFLEDYDVLENEDSDTKKKKYAKKRLKDPITCPKCNRLFYYKAYFQFHYKDVHSEDREEICQFCGKLFKNSRRLNSHILIHQNDSEKKHKCDKCSRQFNFSGDLTRHKRVHENVKPYKCHLCPKSFIQSYALKLHINVHNNVRYTCDLCAAHFGGKPTLKKHMIKCSNGVAVKRSARSNAVERDRYKCLVEACKKQFSSRKYLGIHLEKVHDMKFECFELTCLECQLVFETTGEYSIHVKTHSCNFVCDLCKLRFRTDAKLQAHIKKLHKEGDDRPFICPEVDCGARFKRAEHLKGHQLYKHSDERKFECNLCDLKFRQRGEFNIHMRVHMNSKPFACWQCNFVCTTSSNLRQHMSLVHNETCIYLCKICHQTFKYNTDLTQHKKEHSATTTTTTFEVIEAN